ncbi:MAG: cell division protein SepF [Acidimicrobiaceae bacterium]|nr:cell division protein SepF [Acidimicrobiaceae bacterium]
MNERWRKALGFLGLVEDDYSDYPAMERPFFEDEPQPEPVRARNERPRTMAPPSPYQNPAPVPRTSSVSVLNAGSVTPRPRPVPAPPGGLRGMTPMAEVEILRPTTFDECQAIADNLRNGRASVVVLTEAPSEVRRRLLDFTSGCVYAFLAKIETLEKGRVYLTYPASVRVSPEVRAALKASNYRSVE